jgi:heavy metal translocating P-type ATPase
MTRPGVDLRSISQYATHGRVAAFILAGMLAAWSGPYVFREPQSTNVLLLISSLLASIPLCVELAQAVSKRNFSVDVLAFLSIASSLILGQYWVAAIVILMLSGGKALEEYATHRASSVLNALARRMPQIAHRVEPGGSLVDVPIEDIAVGENLAVHPHELCPVDGVVVSGNGTMDESYLTGEPFEIAKAPGATVLSGAINGDAALTIQATRIANDSRYAKIVEVLRASEKNRPRIRRLGDRLGMWYAPLSIAIAVLSWVFSGEPERFLAVLVIATPCPLLLAIPVAIIGGISAGARRGIVIKDPSILEKLESCRTLIVDKTGTLTFGKPALTDVVCAERWPRKLLLQFAASLERYSKHPLASAILTAAKEDGIELLNAQDVSESPGKGLAGHIQGHSVQLTSRAHLPAEWKGRLTDVAPGLECVVLIDGALGGCLRFHDQPRSESKAFLSHVESRHGIERIILLSGDRPSEVANFAVGMGISTAHGGKSPEEKMAIVQDLTAQSPTLYIGDGVNDAPAMLNATAGIALGVNSDITSEAAGAVILQSSLAGVDELIHIGARMRRIAITSAIGGMLLSALGMCAGALGYLEPIEGAILQEVIDLLSILNSLRMMLPSARIGDFVVTEHKVPSPNTGLATAAGTHF